MLLCIQSRSLTYGMVPPTFKEGPLTSALWRNSLTTAMPQFVYSVILDPVKLMGNINHGKKPGGLPGVAVLVYYNILLQAIAKNPEQFLPF